MRLTSSRYPSLEFEPQQNPSGVSPCRRETCVTWEYTREYTCAITHRSPLNVAIENATRINIYRSKGHRTTELRRSSRQRRSDGNLPGTCENETAASEIIAMDFTLINPVAACFHTDASFVEEILTAFDAPWNNYISGKRPRLAFSTLFPRDKIDVDGNLPYEDPRSLAGDIWCQQNSADEFRNRERPQRVVYVFAYVKDSSVRLYQHTRNFRSIVVVRNVFQHHRRMSWDVSPASPRRSFASIRVPHGNDDIVGSWLLYNSRAMKSNGNLPLVSLPEMHQVLFLFVRIRSSSIQIDIE